MIRLRGKGCSGKGCSAKGALDERGRDITAGQILESVNGDRRLADEYVHLATEAVVMSLKKARPE
jgi:hypothetical protein